MNALLRTALNWDIKGLSPASTYATDFLHNLEQVI